VDVNQLAALAAERDTIMLTTNIAATPDRYPPKGERITTTIALLPQDHRRIAQLGLDLGLDLSSIVRRCLVIAGVLPAHDDDTAVNPSSETEGT